MAAWQTDNEFGCHDTTLSYSQAAKIEFQDWLRKLYKSEKSSNDGNIQALNKDWGNIFWSMSYNNFSDIDLPNKTVTEPTLLISWHFENFHLIKWLSLIKDKWIL